MKSYVKNHSSIDIESILILHLAAQKDIIFDTYFEISTIRNIEKYEQNTIVNRVYDTESVKKRINEETKVENHILLKPGKNGHYNDYKIALYFAVEDALKKDSEDCILWAFNYKLFEDKYGMDKYYYEIPKLEIYRPEYNSNPNINAQKGLFTFWSCTSDDNLLDDTPFDELIITELIENARIDETKTKYHKIEGYERIMIPENIKIFHKFIIPSKLKVKILKELYTEGYTNEFIYPSYRGVVDSIRREVELNEYLQNE